MKKELKIILIIVGFIFLLISIDLGSILLRNKPIFARFENTDSINKIYKGLLYNTYDCVEYPKVQIKVKWIKFSCGRNVIMGKIKQINEEYIIINGLSDSNYLKANQEAHVSLTNNPKIKGSNNLIIGQYIKVISESIMEIYPSLITTHEIEIIYEEDIDY